MSDLKPGDFIAGEYRVRRVFGGHGRSGMGVVYLVEGRSSEMPFVLKTFQSKRANPSSLARFKAEAETWINIGKHPNIVQCHWVREFSDQLFVAAEFIWPDDAGRNTLTQHLASGGLTLRQQLNWIAHFCFGMKHAMAHGMGAHRDIKPDNLMVDNQGRLKVTDFGLAKGLSLAEHNDTFQASDGADESLTVAGTAFGTPPFMSPEQFADSSAVDHRADIYGLGVVIYLMISGGKMPIVVAKRSDDYFGQWALAHRQQRIVRLDSPLMDFAAKCLEKDANRRFQSYDEIFEAVGQACRKHGFAIPHDEQDARAEFERQWGIAMSLNNLGRAEEAITKLQQMAVRWQDSSEVHTEMGAAYSKLWKLQEALQATEKSLALYKYSTAAWNNLGAILTNLDRIPDAKNAYRKALEIEPENTGAMIGLAQLHMAEVELNEARQLCELALFWRPEKPSVLMVASACLMQCGEGKRAADLLEKLVLLPPETKDWSSDFKTRTTWFNLALCRQSLGNLEGSIHAFQKVLKLDPKDAKALTFLAQSLVHLGREEEALAYLDKSLVCDSRFIPTWVNKGNALHMLGKPAEALACFQEAQKLGDPNAVRSVEQCQRLLSRDNDFFERGYAFHQAGNFEEAIRCYDAGLAVDANHPDIWNSKGLALKALGKVREAIECHERALAIDPKNAGAWNGKGNRSVDLGMHEQALDCYSQALAINPRDVNAWYARGSASKALGKLDEAIACYDKALAIEPRMIIVWRDKAATLCRQGRSRDALLCYDKTLEITPQDPSTLLLKGDALGTLGRYQEALVCFQDAEKLGDPNAAKGVEQCRRLLAPDADRYFRLGSDYQQEGNNAEAIRCYEKGLAINPNNGVIWSNKGAALLALKRGAEAVVCFDRAIALDPRDASAWNNKGCALLSLGQQSEGWACLQEAKRLRK
ncbi:MAG: tetratricopeptide repeat protein [Verrucomicrobia bacterium]|nr:tetratricopeptide repeat protein [Verrucomicrobiota bacterium]